MNNTYLTMLTSKLLELSAFQYIIELKRHTTTRFKHVRKSRKKVRKTLEHTIICTIVMNNTCKLDHPSNILTSKLLELSSHY